MQKVRLQSGISLYVRKAIDYINLNIDSNLFVKDIADFCKISEKYMSSLFKKETGLTITEYIEKEKVRTAANLLLYSDFSYAEIADSLQYSSQSYFSRIFKKHYQLSPMQFRMKHKY